MNYPNMAISTKKKLTSLKSGNFDTFFSQNILYEYTHFFLKKNLLASGIFFCRENENVGLSIASG
jgi:hypothetical protein